MPRDDSAPVDPLRPVAPGNGGLPDVSAEAAAHSAYLGALIAEEITAAGGALSFRRFMELALYAPGLGYYSAGSTKFGAAGDFVTAPEISPLFSRTLAQPCAAVLSMLGGGDILEVGAGSGALAAELLAQLAKEGTLPAHYYILELSAELRERQRRTLSQRDATLLERVQWLDALPSGGFRGVLLANEVLDAMPAHRFQVTEDGVQEFYVAGTPGAFCWRLGPPSDARLAGRIADIGTALGVPLPPGYVSEVNFSAEDWVRTVAEHISAGLVLLIDYGFPRREFYHAQRHRGTLMCHFRHRAHDDPLHLVGLQDITTHVDFTAIAEAGAASGLDVAGYTTQAHFLFGSGLALLAQETDPADTVRQLTVSNQVKRLTLPQEMGELFKVIGLERGVDARLPGFALRDLRDRL